MLVTSGCVDAINGEMNISKQSNVAVQVNSLRNGPDVARSIKLKTF